jgi:cytochrome c-type biogenesis protein
LIPSYISFITGLSLEELTEGNGGFKVKGITVLNSILFILGFTAIFAAFGATASLIGELLRQYMGLVGKIAGALVIVFGLYMMGLLKLGFLMRERRVAVRRKPLGAVGSVLVGMAFAAGWTPCIGPILTSILILASQVETIYQGMFLLSVYSLGLGVPFLLTAIFIDSFLNLFHRVRRHLRTVEVVGGAFLVVIGVLIFTNMMQRFTGYLTIVTGWRGL